MATYIVDDLLAAVKVRANIPTSNGSLTDAELLVLGNDELRGILTGRLMEPLQGYLLTETTIPVTAGTALYDLPTRAVGGKISYAVMTKATGERREITNRAVGQLAGASRVAAINNAPNNFYFQGMQIGVYPAPANASESLTIGYYQRPNRMVLTPACARVTAAASVGATSVTCSNASTQIASGTTVDIVTGQPHFRLSNLDLAVTASAVGSVTCTLTGAIAIGDYVCPAGDSCVVQLPVEVQPLLEARWALRVMKARAPSSPDTQALGQDVADLESSVFDFLGNRAETSLETIAPSGLNGRYGRLAWGYSF